MAEHASQHLQEGHIVADPTLVVEKRGAVGIVMLNRPTARNALNQECLRAMMDALVALDRDDDVGAIVVTGSEAVFAAGADIGEMAGRTEDDMVANDPIGIFGRIRDVQKPVIAAVSGWALGGGCELAMSCDMIVASETARFGQPEITIGIIPGAGGTQRLTRAVGKAIAMEMVLNNRILSAHEALQRGLVNRVVAVDRFLEEAVSVAAEIAARARVAVRAGKRMVNRSFELPLNEAVTEERRELYRLFSTEDQKEGMRAFLEKRGPQWKSR